MIICTLRMDHILLHKHYLYLSERVSKKLTTKQLDIETQRCILRHNTVTSCLKSISSKAPKNWNEICYVAHLCLLRHDNVTSLLISLSSKYLKIGRNFAKLRDINIESQKHDILKDVWIISN